MLTFSDNRFNNRIKEDMMQKELSEMTLEELWKLFPIVLVESNKMWNNYFDDMKDFLLKQLKEFHVDRISHIGSTSIQGIWSKNIVDILIEIPENQDIKEIAQTIEKAGFIKMSENTKRISLNKGYTKNGFADKVYHIHLRYTGDNDELYFRDYLNEYPAIAKEYETLKLNLWKKYEYNRDAYTDAKTDFIQKWTTEAHKKYGKRY